MWTTPVWDRRKIESTGFCGTVVNVYVWEVRDQDINGHWLKSSDVGGRSHWLILRMMEAEFLLISNTGHLPSTQVKRSNVSPDALGELIFEKCKGRDLASSLDV